MTLREGRPTADIVDGLVRQANGVEVVDHQCGVGEMLFEGSAVSGGRVQNQTRGHRGRKAERLYRARRVLLTAEGRLSEDRLPGWQACSNSAIPTGRSTPPWVARELLRNVYQAADEAHARRRMIAFYIYCADAEVSELGRLARTVSRWLEEILAYHRTGRASNGRVENAHMLAGKTRRNRTNTRPPTMVHRVEPPIHLTPDRRAERCRRARSLVLLEACTPMIRSGSASPVSS